MTFFLALVLLLGSILPYLFSGRLASVLSALVFGVLSGIVALALQAEALALALISITGFQVFLMSGVLNQNDKAKGATENRWVRGAVGILLSVSVYCLLLVFREGDAPKMGIQTLENFRIGSAGVFFCLFISMLFLGVINARRR